MFEENPWILITLLVILALSAVLGIILARKLKGTGKSVFSMFNMKILLIQWITGLLCSLFGAFLMFNGELFGDNTTGIARIIGIIGICLIASAGPLGMAVKRKM